MKTQIILKFLLFLFFKKLTILGKIRSSITIKPHKSEIFFLLYEEQHTFVNVKQKVSSLYSNIDLIILKY